MAANTDPIFTPKQNIRVNFTDGRVAKIALAGVSKVKVQAEPLAAAAVAARMRFGQYADVVDNQNDVPVRSDDMQPQPFRLPEGATVLLLVADKSQAPSVAAPIAVNVTLGV